MSNIEQTCLSTAALEQLGSFFQVRPHRSRRFLVGFQLLLLLMQPTLAGDKRVLLQRNLALSAAIVAFGMVLGMPVQAVAAGFAVDDVLERRRRDVQSSVGYQQFRNDRRRK